LFCVAQFFGVVAGVSQRGDVSAMIATTENKSSSSGGCQSYVDATRQGHRTVSDAVAFKENTMKTRAGRGGGGGWGGGGGIRMVAGKGLGKDSAPRKRPRFGLHGHSEDERYPRILLGNYNRRDRIIRRAPKGFTFFAQQVDGALTASNATAAWSTAWSVARPNMARSRPTRRWCVRRRVKNSG